MSISRAHASASRRLSDVADRIMVGIASAATHAYRNAGVPMVRNTNIKEGRIEEDQLLYLDTTYERQHKNKRLRRGDVVVVRTGNPGIAAVVPASLEGAQCFTSLIIRPKHELLDPEFLSAFINSPAGQRQFSVGAAGGAQKNVNARTLSRMHILVPTLNRQRDIVRLARLFNEQRSNVDRLSKLILTYKRGLMAVLLGGKRRFQGFEGKPWAKVSLGELFTERDETGREDLPLLSVTNDRGVIPRHELAKRDTSNPDKSSYKRVAVGDIAYNTMRMWQGVSALSSLEGIVSPAYTVAIPSPAIDGHFAKHLFKYAPVVNLFYRYSQGLVDDTLNLKFDRFSKVEVSIPSSLQEQRKIAAVLNVCDEEAALLRGLREKNDVHQRNVLGRLLSAA